MWADSRPFDYVVLQPGSEGGSVATWCRTISSTHIERSRPATPVLAHEKAHRSLSDAASHHDAQLCEPNVVDRQHTYPAFLDGIDGDGGVEPSDSELLRAFLPGRDVRQADPACASFAGAKLDFDRDAEETDHQQRWSHDATDTPVSRRRDALNPFG